VIDIGKHTFEVPCPRCSFYNPFYFHQAVVRDVIICRGCKGNIQLDDHMNECQKAHRAIRRAFRELEQEINKLNSALRF